MNPNIAIRLDNRRGNSLYDAEFSSKISKTARDYIENGLQTLNYYLADFDAATDLVEMYAPIEDSANFSKLDRNLALNFRHPMTFTEMVTLTTFLSQILFGGEQARSVEAQGPDDATKADDVNALLAWNDVKMGIYLQGWLWIWAAVVYNRGVWFEDTDQDVVVEREAIEEDDLSKPQVQVKNRDGSLRVRNGKPVMEYQKMVRYRNKRARSGFFNTLHIVSPYDFICDPTLPFMQFQQGRFAGHRVYIPWYELKERSELDPSDDKYVLPGVVAKIKTNRGNSVTPSALGGTQDANSTRTYFERQVRGGIATGLGGVGSMMGGDQVNKEDGGTVECFNLTIRAKPKTLSMYDDDEFELITMLTTSTGDVLSVNVRPNKHDEYPYAPAEARPNAHRQFSPGWALAIKPCQDRVDDLNQTHSTAQKRMGNILLIDPTKCDASNLLAPDKNGLMILRTDKGRGVPSEEIVKQIPLQDVTSGYNDEMAMWQKTAENTTGAHAFTQGVTEDPSQTLGQFDAVKQMATGRISSIARMLAEQALRPQTRRFVCNFQQFMDEETTIRIVGKGQDFDAENPREDYVTIQKANIQGEYDVVPQDGSMPGADAKIVAAAARTLEAYATNPAFAEAFNKTIPGALNVIKILKDMLKKSGLPVEKYEITTQEAQQNAKQALNAQGIPQPGMDATGAPAGPQPPTDATGGASAAILPPNPTAAPPSPHPGNV